MVAGAGTVSECARAAGTALDGGARSEEGIAAAGGVGAAEQMTALGLIIVIFLAAVLVWVVPMPVILQRLLYAVVIIAFVLWILGIAGVNIGLRLR